MSSQEDSSTGKLVLFISFYIPL